MAAPMNSATCPPVVPPPVSNDVNDISGANNAVVSLTGLDDLVLHRILDSSSPGLTDIFLRLGSKELMRAALHASSPGMRSRVRAAVARCVEPAELGALLSNKNAVAVLKALPAGDIPAPKQISGAISAIRKARYRPYGQASSSDEERKNLVTAARETLTEHAAHAAVLLDLVDGPTDTLAAWLWRGVGTFWLTNNERPPASVLLTFNAVVWRARALNLNLSGPDQIWPNFNYAEPSAAKLLSLASNHLEELVLGWDFTTHWEKVNGVTPHAALDVLSALRQKTALRVLDLRNLRDTTDARIDADTYPCIDGVTFPSLLSAAWKNEPLLLSTLYDLRIDGSVCGGNGLASFLRSARQHLPLLRRLRLGTLKLGDRVTKEDFLDALSKLAPHLEQLTLADAELLIKDEREGVRLGNLLSPVPNLVLLVGFHERERLANDNHSFGADGEVRDVYAATLAAHARARVEAALAIDAG